jgi:hypothetical protein
MEFLDVRFQAPKRVASDLRSFYLDGLELDPIDNVESDLIAVRVGSSVVRFSEDRSLVDPFYHFALLVPGDRFASAHAWLKARVDLLPDPETGDTVFDFTFWRALACYFLDPAGNIVELIAHSGISHVSIEGPFRAHELVGISEVGLVVPDMAQSVATLERELGLPLWQGEVGDPARLGFVGEQGRTLILCRPGRGWLPTGRPAEVYPVHITIKGGRRSTVTLPGTPHRIRSR